VTAEAGAPPVHDLDAASIRAGLAGRRIGRRVVVHTVVASTMDVLAALAEAGEAEGTVAIADLQRAGRGRLDRLWVAPPGTSLMLSVLFRPTVPRARHGETMMAVALGALDALDPLLPPGVAAALKWPNDVVVGGRKIAGLLAESHPRPGRDDAVIVGVGLNVRQTGADLWPGATSLAAEGVAGPARSALAVALLTAVDRHYECLEHGESLVASWASRLDTIGREVVASSGHGEVRGRAVGVAPDGALQIATPEGAVVTVHAGDVTLAGDRPGATPG
jgi:BirA family transcriptional regulator, biotin operon repressor / biotin---[acetyl-CoA-carboxylase] ligase